LKKEKHIQILFIHLITLLPTNYARLTGAEGGRFLCFGVVGVCGLEVLGVEFFEDRGVAFERSSL
jgi:hypothetical protein